MENRGSQKMKYQLINKLNIFIMVKLKTLVMILGFLVGSSGSSYAQGFLDKVLKGLEKTNEVLDQTDKLLGGDDNENASSQSSSRSKRVTGFKIVSPHPDLEIQFKRCAASASTVIIDLVMTWYGDDANITLGGEVSQKNTTIAYDDNGKQYSFRQIPISVGGGRWDSYGNFSTLFPTDVPIKVRLEIHDVSESVLEFKRLQISMKGVNDPITLYNVPITRNDVSQNIIPVESDGEPANLQPLDQKVNEEFVSKPDNYKDIAKEKELPIEPQITSKTKIIYLDFEPYSGSCTDANSGVFLIKNRQDYYAIFDTLGNQITDFKFESSKFFKQMPIFENGYCAIRDSKGSYIIDTKGNITTPKEKIFDLSNFQDGIATASQIYIDPKNKLRKLNRNVFVNTKGEIIFKHLSSNFDWGRVIPMRPFCNNLAAFHNYETKKWGFINHDGKVIVEPIYKNVQDFRDGYAAVQTEEGKWGYIDTTGKMVINAIYAMEPSAFTEGYAHVVKRNGGLSLINKNGDIVLDNIDEISYFYEGKAFVKFNHNSPIRKQHGGGNKGDVFIIDKNLKFIKIAKSWAFDYKTSSSDTYWPENDGLIFGKGGGILVSSDGQTIYKAFGIRLFHENIAYCRVPGEKYKTHEGFINRSGEVVFMFKESVY